MGAAEGPGPASTSGQLPRFSIAAMKLSLQKYGRTGVAVYLGISFCVTTSCYVAIENHVDMKKILGIKDDPGREPTAMERIFTGRGSSLALALLCSKAFIPIKLPVALAITPYVYRWREKLLKQAAARVVNGKGPGSAV